MAANTPNWDDLKPAAPDWDSLTAKSTPPPVLPNQMPGATQQDLLAAQDAMIANNPETPMAKAKMMGQAIGSATLKVGLPAAAVAAAPFTGGASLAAIGGLAGAAGEYLGNKVAGEESTPGGLASAAILGASPISGSPAAAGVKELAFQGAKMAGFGYGAESARSLLDTPEKGLPKGWEAFMATAPNLLAAPIAKFMDTGTNSVQQAYNQSASQNAEKEAILRAGQKEGYAVLPLKVRQGYQERMLNLGAGGQELSNPLAQQASINNQAVTNKLARQVAGLDESAAITEDALAQARKDAAKPYEDVAKLSNQAQSTLDALTQTRRDAKNAWRIYSGQANPDPALKATAQAKDAEAEVLENALADEAKKAGQPGLISDLKDARKQIAQIHVLEAARMEGGDINPKVIAAIGETKKLDGQLKTIAQMASVFPESMRPANNIVLSPGGSKLLSFTGLDQAMKKFALSNFYQKNLNYNYGGQAPDAVAQFARFSTPAAAQAFAPK